MSEASKLAKTSTKGGFNLFWGTALSGIISSLGILVVAGILEEGQYGLYGIALIAPNLFQLVRDFGVDQATIKYTAQYNHENQSSKIKNILNAAISFEFIVSLILSLFSFIISGYIATEIFDRPEIIILIQIASFTIFGSALFKVADSSFIGYEKMQYHSITLVFQSIFKTILMIVLVLSNFGVAGAIIGHTAAMITAGIVGMIILYFKIYKKLNNKNNAQLIQTLKNMLKYGIPLSISIVLAGLLTQFYAFLIAIYLSNQIIGNYNLALNFAMLVGFFVTPISTLMFPAFSKIDGQKDPITLRNVYRYSVKYASLLIVPAALMVMALSQPAVSTLFPGKYEQTPFYLSLYIIAYLFSAFGHLSNGNLIKGQGRTDVNLKLGILNTILGITLSLVLIPKYGVIGLIATTLISIIPQIIISLWWIKKNYEATVDYKASIKILIAALISTGLTYFAITFLNIANWIILIIGAVIFLASYLIIAPLIGAINKEDTKNLKEMIKALGPLTPILNIPLNIIEKLAIKFQKQNN